MFFFLIFWYIFLFFKHSKIHADSHYVFFSINTYNLFALMVKLYNIIIVFEFVLDLKLIRYVKLEKSLFGAQWYRWIRWIRHSRFIKFIVNYFVRKYNSITIAQKYSMYILCFVQFFWTNKIILWSNDESKNFTINSM